MADLYLDHGAYAAYAATPTWAVPQDGDGKAKAASASAATASITFSGVPAGTISICGVTVSPTWGASADAAANGLATAINAATGNVTTTGFRASSVQLRNAVFARGPAGGAPAGTCQIMTRHGSADFNGQVAIAHTLTNVSASSLNFSGGVSGCWGYLLNIAALWPSSVALANYGLMCATLPFAGALAPGDVVKIRANKTITLTTNTAYVTTFAAMGSKAAPVVFQIDDGTEWPADGSTPVLTIFQSNNGQTRSDTTGAANSWLHILGKKYASGQRNLVFDIRSTGNGDVVAHHRLIVQGAPIRIRSASFLGKTFIEGFAAGSATVRAQLVDCFFQYQTQHATSLVAQINGAVLDLISVEFNQIAPTAAQTAGVVGYGGAAAGQINFFGVKFTGFVAGSRLFTFAGITEAQEHTFQNCDFGNVTLRTGLLSVLDASSFRSFGYVMGNSAGPGRDFFYETAQGFVEWHSTRGYPTLNATLNGSLTPWVLYASPTNQANNLSAFTPFRLPQLTKVNSLATGTRTLTVNLLVESTLAWTRRDVSVTVTYTDASGVQTVDSFDPLGSALTASSASWSSTSYNGQTWLKRSFDISLPGLLTGAEVAVTLNLHSNAANNSLGVFIDPELLLT